MGAGRNSPRGKKQIGKKSPKLDGRAKISKMARLRLLAKDLSRKQGTYIPVKRER